MSTDLLARLIDERAIERLLIDYVALNDAGQWHAVAALYTADGRLSRPSSPDVFIEGREAILAAFLARPPRRARHIIANVRIDLDGDTARVTSQILLYTAGGGAPLVGGYADRVVRSAEGWRFAERIGSLDFPGG